MQLSSKHLLAVFVLPPHTHTTLFKEVLFTRLHYEPQHTEAWTFSQATLYLSFSLATFCISNSLSLSVSLSNWRLYAKAVVLEILWTKERAVDSQLSRGKGSITVHSIPVPNCFRNSQASYSLLFLLCFIKTTAYGFGWLLWIWLMDYLWLSEWYFRKWMVFCMNC